jgi:peroxin-11B
LEHAQAAVKSLEIEDPVLKFTALGRQLGYAGYLYHDMLIWVQFDWCACCLRATVADQPLQAHTAKVFPLTAPRAQTVNRRAAKLWFTGIAFSIVSSIYRLIDINRREQQARRVRSSEKESDRKVELKTVLA